MIFLFVKTKIISYCVAVFTVVALFICSNYIDMNSKSVEVNTSIIKDEIINSI